MFYYFKDKQKLLEVKLEFKGHDYMFNSYKMQLYSVDISAPQAFQFCGILEVVYSAIFLGRLSLSSLTSTTPELLLLLRENKKKCFHGKHKLKGILYPYPLTENCIQYCIICYKGTSS
jgi:hypothetical protein